MPNRYFFREALEEASAIGGHREISSFAFCACISLPGFQPAYQIHLRAIGQRDLLMTSTNPEYRLRCFLDYIDYTGQRFGSVPIPGMTLATQDYVRRAKRLYAFERNGVIGLCEYLHSFLYPAEHGAEFARACALTLKRIVDEIDQRC